MLVDGGGGVGAMYVVQIESLQTFQQRLTTILQSLEQDNSVMSMSDGSNTFGNFPEAQSFASTYEQTKQDLIDSFNEVTQLVDTMINVVGTSANRYAQTEQDITAKFNAILQQYGDTATATPMLSGTPIAGAGSTTSGTTGSGTTYYPQSSGAGSTYSVPDDKLAVESGTTTDDGTSTGASTSTDSSTDTTTTSTYDSATTPDGSTTTNASTDTNTSAGAA